MALFDDHFNPKIIAKVNDSHVKLVKFKGDFIWHHHEEEDELFLVIKGKMRMETRGRTLFLNEGEMVVIPKKTEHKPAAEGEVHVMLFEPIGTVNTGNIHDEKTREHLERI